ncbi:TPA: hypothetical protein JI457_004696 [Salmonella enterica subsp. enterica]|nr:hypothetical protein [Salmonella enterica subsp. enterica]
MSFISGPGSGGGANQRTAPQWMLPLLLGLYGSVTSALKAAELYPRAHHVPIRCSRLRSYGHGGPNSVDRDLSRYRGRGDPDMIRYIDEFGQTTTRMQ